MSASEHIRNLLLQMLDFTPIGLAVPAEEPSVGDVTSVDGFVRDGGSGDGNADAEYQKLSLGKNAGRLAATCEGLDLSGEVLREADPTRDFGRLVNEGKARGARQGEGDLLNILKEAESGARAHVPPASQVAATPVATALAGIRDDLPLVEDDKDGGEDGRNSKGGRNDDEKDDDEESTEADTGTDLKIRLRRNNISTFA